MKNLAERLQEYHIGDRIWINRYVTEFGILTKRNVRNDGRFVHQRLSGIIVYISPAPRLNRFVVVDLGKYRESFWLDEIL